MPLHIVLLSAEPVQKKMDVAAVAIVIGVPISRGPTLH